jgi:dienelactone hydrolase
MRSKHQALSAYERFAFTDGQWTRDVYRRGSGPAVIVIHEIPGLHPLVIRFADRVAAAGMTVHLPVLFGEPGRSPSPGERRGADQRRGTTGDCVFQAEDRGVAQRSFPLGLP